MSTEIRRRAEIVLHQDQLHIVSTQALIFDQQWSEQKSEKSLTHCPISSTLLIHRTLPNPGDPMITSYNQLKAPIIQGTLWSRSKMPQNVQAAASIAWERKAKTSPYTETPAFTSLQRYWVSSQQEHPVHFHQPDRHPVWLFTWRSRILLLCCLRLRCSMRFERPQRS